MALWRRGPLVTDLQIANQLRVSGSRASRRLAGIPSAHSTRGAAQPVVVLFCQI